MSSLLRRDRHPSRVTPRSLRFVVSRLVTVDTHQKRIVLGTPSVHPVSCPSLGVSLTPGRMDPSITTIDRLKKSVKDR